MAVTWARAKHGASMGIPARAEQPFRKEAEHRSGPKLKHHRRSSGGFLIFREVFDFVKTNHPERSGGRRLDPRMGVRGKGCPLPRLGTGEILWMSWPE